VDANLMDDSEYAKPKASRVDRMLFPMMPHISRT